MLEDLFSLFNTVMVDLPTEDWFVYVIASGVLFGLGCLIKIIVVKGD